MCAIVGIIERKNSLMSSKELFSMSRVQRHRGPDDEGGAFLDLRNHKVGGLCDEEDVDCKGMLGFQRLSIQDLSDRGHQPMQNETSDCAIVFNGEIYNFRELRRDLECKGCVFKSHTDTEVILRMYETYGIMETLKQVNGMFAFAIADMRIGKIYLARDRFGIKPVYVTYAENGAFLFASEMKAFLRYHGFQPRLNMEALGEYMLFFGGLKNTLLQGVEELDAGTVLEIDLNTNEFAVRKYFDVESCNRNNAECTYSDLKERIWETLKNVVSRQVVSDVRVGCQLSGGIDSSILTMLASNEHKITDTIGCKTDSDKQSDGIYIDTVNEKLDLDAHITKINAEIFIKNLVDVVWHFDSIMPYTPPAGLLQISKCAKSNNIKVLLSGEGADELFGGYQCFGTLAFADKQPTKEQEFRTIVLRHGSESEQFLKKILPSIQTEKYYQERADILNHFTGSSFDRQVKYELSVHLKEILCRQDKMSMAYSVENRVPYLDNEMVQLAWDIPERFLMNRERHEGKYVLKNIAEDLFGCDFAYRKKVAFFIPGNVYLDTNKEFLHRIFSCMKKRGVICGDILEQWADEKIGIYGALNHFESALFLKMITLEIWCQLFIDGLTVEECKEKLLWQRR